jgi:hypothetical protein
MLESYQNREPSSCSRAYSLGYPNGDLHLNQRPAAHTIHCRQHVVNYTLDFPDDIASNLLRQFRDDADSKLDTVRPRTSQANRRISRWPGCATNCIRIRPRSCRSPTSTANVDMSPQQRIVTTWKLVCGSVLLGAFAAAKSSHLRQDDSRVRRVPTMLHVAVDLHSQSRSSLLERKCFPRSRRITTFARAVRADAFANRATIVLSSPGSSISCNARTSVTRSAPSSLYEPWCTSMRSAATLFRSRKSETHP